MPTVLTQGDIAIVGYASDDPDSFSFVVLRELGIEAGTTINFTDNGWLASGGFRSGEGTVNYVASTAIEFGTVVTLTGLDLDDAGDQIIAYQGNAATPTLIYAIDFADGNQAFAGDATSTTTSAIPTGLVPGLTAVALAPDYWHLHRPGHGIEARYCSRRSAIRQTGPAAIFFAMFREASSGSPGRKSTSIATTPPFAYWGNYFTEYTIGGAAVSVADTDIRIADSDNLFLWSAKIDINGTDPGDLLAVDGALPLGITASPYDPNNGVLWLSGFASLDAYEIGDQAGQVQQHNRLRRRRKVDRGDGFRRVQFQPRGVCFHRRRGGHPTGSRPR